MGNKAISNWTNPERFESARTSPEHDAELAGLVSEYLERDGRSLNRIAQGALIDVGYLWRLQHGERINPSRDVLIRLGLALRLEPEELDELLVAANYASITLRRS